MPNCRKDESNLILKERGCWFLRLYQILEHQDINMGNTAEKRVEIVPREEVLKKTNPALEIEISACGLQLIQFKKK